MNIAVCDDNSIDRELIVSLLNMYFVNRPISNEIIQYESGVDLLYDFEDGMWFDIIFLDIYMNDLLGIDVAHKLRTLGYSRHIIFLTSTSDFAVDSYDVEALGYLLKPHSFEKLSQVMDRATRDIATNTYQIKNHSKVIMVSYHNILYVESNNSKCILHCRDGQSYAIYKRLDTIEQELNDERFLRCHQSYLVNMDYIRQIDSQFTLATGDTVLIRKRSLKAIRQTALDYMEKKHLLSPSNP
ncbi:MAG: LytTR family DNA-binding domain-containing protein [Clostridiales bacterium]|nr:LytTR family DNA-binding domain-containing protein [Clostridiales bacterium]